MDRLPSHNTPSAASLIKVMKVASLIGAASLLAACANISSIYDSVFSGGRGIATPELWPTLEAQPLDPTIEARVDDILAKLTLEQKVGQIIQADSASVTPADVKKYRLGSVLSGGNSAPGDKQYADAETWLALTDSYYKASIDTEGVDVAVPVLLGIDAVHGHTNLFGAIVFPHNIGLGAAQNPDLVEEIARITAFELTVSGHDWTFAPTLAVPQDLRWGRAYEGFSEDPSIVAAYANRIVYGLQGRPGDADFMGSNRVVSSAKHFLGDGGTKDGVDQGDARISEDDLRDIHAPGYYTAIPANVQTVMASFSSWQGRKLHGAESLLTGVLKDRMAFNGFVIGDWNGHGQVKGCTNTSCPHAINAGLDMFMAPDSWKELYENTLRQVKDGDISQERLDDAVRRILRVKLISGLDKKGAPSERPNAGEQSLLGASANRAVARQAVRESLVLLKNNNATLPLDPRKKILIIGDGADSIAKAAGGWTLSWQGGKHTNDEFPNGRSILSGIKEAVSAAGGEVVFAPTGQTSETADIVIAVYGEDPYAEFKGDRDNLDFVPNGFDTTVLASFKARGVPVVSVFLSGRPLWTNPELNASDAFIAAWLPGSEGGGVADLLFNSAADFDYSGTLPFRWPNSASPSPEDAPLFPVGYGLTLNDVSDLEPLPEVSGIKATPTSATISLFSKGQIAPPWQMSLNTQETSEVIDSLPSALGEISIKPTDYAAQEDAIRITWRGAGGETVRLATTSPIDLSKMGASSALSFTARSFSEGESVNITLACENDTSCAEAVALNELDESWRHFTIDFRCFAKDDADWDRFDGSLVISSESANDVGLADLRIEEAKASDPNCPS